MSYSTLKSDIEAAVYPNGEREVTALMVQQVLKEIVDTLGAGYQFMGVATTGTTPPSLDIKMFYLAPEGIYTHFGLTVATGKLGVFTYDGTWICTELTLGSGGGGGVTVVDNLTSTSSTDALSARQGKVLNDGKADRVTGATNGNLAGLDSNGNLTDSGKKASDFQTALSTQTAYTSKGSATKVPQITTNTLGQVTGISEVTITQPDVTGKADKVTGATSGDFAALDSNGNLTDSGKKASDFQTALASQTAYTAKGSATKVAQISTNNLGQVTGISEVTISQPTVYNKTITMQANGATVGSFTTNPSANKTIDFGNLVKSGTAGLKFEVVASMPATPDANTIYIVQ